MPWRRQTSRLRPRIAIIIVHRALHPKISTTIHLGELPRKDVVVRVAYLVMRKRTQGALKVHHSTRAGREDPLLKPYARHLPLPQTTVDLLTARAHRTEAEHGAMQAPGCQQPRHGLLVQAPTVKELRVVAARGALHSKVPSRPG